MSDQRVQLERLDTLLRAVVRQLNRATSAHLAEYELTPSRFFVLQMLGRCGRCGGLTMGALQDRLGLAASSVTELVDGLVEAGLAVRERSPNDRRVVLVRLTENGFEVLNKSWEYRLQLLQAAVHPLAPEQLRSLLEFLELLLQGIPGGEAGGGDRGIGRQDPR
ncbi:MAG: MarR family transcriptional regulator [Limnochordales bacterium]|nr:MarR family transcriptional regulator [Limnochordales bacterium]